MSKLIEETRSFLEESQADQSISESAGARYDKIKEFVKWRGKNLTYYAKNTNIELSIGSDKNGVSHVIITPSYRYKFDTIPSDLKKTMTKEFSPYGKVKFNTKDHKPDSLNEESSNNSMTEYSSFDTWEKECKKRGFEIQQIAGLPDPENGPSDEDMSPAWASFDKEGYETGEFVTTFNKRTGNFKHYGILFETYADYMKHYHR